MFCYYNKQLHADLELVLYEFYANNKCQVSLVVKYSSREMLTEIQFTHTKSLCLVLEWQILQLSPTYFVWR